MGQRHPRSTLCERTRAWASLSLDSELSEFERALFQSHLERCAECASFSADIASVTSELRAAPLEALPHPITLPARRRRFGGSALRVGAAAAVVVGALGLAGSLSLPSDSTQEAPEVDVRTSEQLDDRLIREPRLDSLKPTPPADPGRKVLGLPL